jgi:hypothetical protein
VIIVAPGDERPYDEDEWRDALVLVEHGMIELETASGIRTSFVAGDILWLVGLGVRVLRNRGSIPAVMASITRR